MPYPAIIGGAHIHVVQGFRIHTIFRRSLHGHMVELGEPVEVGNILSGIIARQCGKHICGRHTRLLTFGGISREESKTTNNATLIFLLCMVLVYLILCALYESVFIPFAVLLSVPCGLMGSFLFAWLFGLENNIYMQTGLIMIIGLLAKTAILLTEYAGKRRSEGMTLAQAAYSAAKVRLRPILMTVLSMVFGLIPLMLAHGVGANGSRSLATGVIGGMIVGTLALLFLVPSLFIVFQYIQERVKHN